MRRQAAIVTDGSVRGIVFGGNELHIFVSKAENVDGFLNQVSIFVADVTKLGGGDADEEDSVAGMAVAGGFQPGVVGVAVDFLFQSVEDARPGIRDDGGTGERHWLPE